MLAAACLTLTASCSGDGGNPGDTCVGVGCGPAVAGFPATGISGSGGAAGMIAASGAGGVGPRGGTGGGVVPPPPSGSGGASAAGGAGGVGGSAGMAGAMAGSSGAAGAAGSTAGAGGDTAPIGNSAGCDAADWPESGTFMIDVAGMMREYIVKIPDGYDSSKPYKLVFAWHYLGGSAAGIAGGFGGGYYGLESRAQGTAIFVAPEGIDAAWPNTGGRDVAFATAMVDWMRTNYCIDNARIFSVGFSYGAIMSNTVGCQMGDVFRAIAPMSGSGPRSFGGGSCKGPVAAWLAHGTSDGTVSFASGQGSRDHWVEANGCDAQTMPTDPSPCVAYQGCDDGFPVTWCEFAGGHTQFSGAGAAIWTFFSQF